MARPRPKKEPQRSVGQVLRDGRKKLEEELGRKVSFDKITKAINAEPYMVDVTSETVRVYHADGGGEKLNALLIAALIDLYGLSADDLPAAQAGRIALALQLLKRVARGGTPPGTRTRNLQVPGQTRAKRVTSDIKDSDDSAVVAA